MKGSSVMSKTPDSRLVGRVLIVIPLSVAVLAFALHWMYADIIQPAFSYMGQRYVPADASTLIVVWLIATVTALTLPVRIRRPSSTMLWILYVVTVAPTVLMSPYLGIVDQAEAVAIATGFGTAFAMVSLAVRRATPTRLIIRRPSQTTFWLLVGAFSAFVYVYIGVTVGLNLRFLSVLDVYDVRDDYAAALEGAGILGYLVSPQANVVNPLIMARGIYSRRWGLVALGMVGQLILYSGTGFKTILFSIPAVILVALLFRSNLRPRGAVFIWGVSAVIVVAAVLDQLTHSIVWSSLFSRRFLLTPARLSDQYYEFFTNTRFDLLSHSVLAPFIPPQHPYGPARMISIVATGTPDASMNANFFADGYAHFGWLGVAGAAVILTVYLRILDRAAHGLPTAVSSLVVILPAVTLSNTSILTSMLTHGLVVLVFMLMIAPRGKWGVRPQRRPPVNSWLGSHSVA